VLPQKSLGLLACLLQQTAKKKIMTIMTMMMKLCALGFCGICWLGFFALYAELGYICQLWK
jgi:hypothetical protein